MFEKVKKNLDRNVSDTTEERSETELLYNFESNDNTSEVPEECKNDGENTVKTKPSIRKSRLREKNPIPEFTPRKTRSQSSKVQKSDSLSPKTARSASTKRTKPEKNSSQSNKKARNA